LIDRCAGRRIADRLRALGHDVAEARHSATDPGDEALLTWAFDEDRVLVTMDKDFGALIYLGGASHAGLIRLPHVPSHERVALIEQLLADYTPEQIERSIVTVRGTRVRISRGRRAGRP
jgi:predicted nuclease of predicted toxin-antitoxin system